MLRHGALVLLHELQQPGAQALWAAGQCARAYASSRSVPAWALGKPKAEKQERIFKKRVGRLMRELGQGSGAAPSSSSGGGGGGAAAGAEASAAALDLPSSSGSGDAGAGAPAPPSSSDGAGSTAAAEARAEAPAEAPTSSSGGGGGGGGAAAAEKSEGGGGAYKGWLSGILRGILPGMGSSKPAPPRRASPLMQSAPTALSGRERDLAAQAAAAAAAQEAALNERSAAQHAARKAAAKNDSAPDPWEDITLMRNMTLDEYLQQVRQWKGEDAPPRPEPPQRRGIDSKRVVYLRWQQHEIIIQSMSDGEGALIRLDPSAAAANTALLAALSARTGYSFGEVRDVVTCYKEMRDRIDALAAWRDSGRPLPDMSDQDGKTKIIEDVKQERHQADLDVLLARRDRANCPVKPYVRMLGRRAECPNTKLPYMHCCGAK
ncbi:MAG: hypothetical protein J3K34DRAFT_460550 [Monoraphidium minutum]|nr:MAG: hypothetical protein J3K34DRAFT_460550 [Monoraphidium minutum]